METQGVGILAAVYVALLNHPTDEWRIRNQRLYCEVRDQLSRQLGRDAEDVQTLFETVARGF